MKKNDQKDALELKGIEFDVVITVIPKELYGLDILEQINKGRPTPLSFSSLYPALNRLIRKGYIDWRWGEVTDGTGGARRKYYKATGLGQKAAKQWMDYYSQQQLKLKPIFGGTRN